MSNSNIFQEINTASVVANNCHNWFQDASNNVNRRYYTGMQDNIRSQSEKELDTYPVDNPLNEEDTRILFKILRKEYADCGRKRGAVLRYIKAYRELKPEPIGQRLYNQLTNYET
jgi:hypothetical protein